jgi:hypothetical protein
VIATRPNFNPFMAFVLIVLDRCWAPAVKHPTPALTEP